MSLDKGTLDKAYVDFIAAQITTMKGNRILLARINTVNRTDDAPLDVTATSFVKIGLSLNLQTVYFTYAALGGFGFSTLYLDNFAIVKKTGAVLPYIRIYDETDTSVVGSSIRPDQDDYSFNIGLNTVTPVNDHVYSLEGQVSATEHMYILQAGFLIYAEIE